MLSKRAQAFVGKRVRLTRDGIGVVSMRGGFRIVRRTAKGDTGTITSVSDAGFNGLIFRVKMDGHGDSINAYERSEVEVIG